MNYFLSMTSVTCNSSKVLFAALAVLQILAVRPCAADFGYSSAYVLPGLYLSHNTRSVYREFPDGEVHIANSGFFMLGVSAGKRFGLAQRLRIQTVFEGGWGMVNDEESYYDHTSIIIPFPAQEFCNYWTGGVLADLHWLFPAGERAFFLSAGPGFHLTYFHPVLKSASGQNLPDFRVKHESMTPSLSFNIGTGLEYQSDGKKGGAIEYKLRLWQPVRYAYTGDILPKGIDQRESFITHILQVQVLLPGSR